MVFSPTFPWPQRMETRTAEMEKHAAEPYVMKNQVAGLAAGEKIKIKLKVIREHRHYFESSGLVGLWTLVPGSPLLMPPALSPGRKRPTRMTMNPGQRAPFPR